MLQSKAGIENREYKAQRALLADVDAGKISKEDLFAHAELMLKERMPAPAGHKPAAPAVARPPCAARGRRGACGDDALTYKKKAGPKAGPAFLSACKARTRTGSECPALLYKVRPQPDLPESYPLPTNFLSSAIGTAPRP